MPSWSRPHLLTHNDAREAEKVYSAASIHTPATVLPHQIVEPLPVHGENRVVMAGPPVDGAPADAEVTEQLVVAPHADGGVSVLDVSRRKCKLNSVHGHTRKGNQALDVSAH